MSNRVKKRGLILLAILGTVFLPVLGMAAQQTQDRAAVERGRVVYQKYGCFVCHGLGGAGGVRNKNSSARPGMNYAKEEGGKSMRGS